MNDEDTHAPPSRISYWIKLPLVLLLMFLTTLAILRSNNMADDFPHESVKPEARKPFPDLELIDEDGNKEKITDYKGYVTLVSFWATWCGPCLDELPYFSKLAKKYPDDLRIIAINQDRDPDVKETIDNLWKKYTIPFKNFYDPIGESAKRVQLEVLPSNYVLDRNGLLIFSSFGANDWHSEKAVHFLEELISEKTNNQ